MIYLGTSGWYYEDWIDNFYPKNIKKSEWLDFYAKIFNTVEVNTSFYRLPFENMMKGWVRKTPDDFLLTFKGSQFVTHRKKLKDVDEYLELFYKRIGLAEKKVGIILWQFPPQLKKDMDLLENFLTILNHNYKQCIEFRHKSWFEEEVYHLLKKYDIAFCMVSAPKLSSTIQVTADFAYIRWHGKDNWYRYNYSKNELRQWAETIKSMDVQDVYGYFNNDYHGFAPKNCLKLAELIK